MWAWLRRRTCIVMKARWYSYKQSGEVQIDETLWMHKVKQMNYEEHPDVYGFQQRIFGVHEEKKQANGLNLTILYCFEDQTAGKIGEILRKN